MKQLFVAAIVLQLIVEFGVGVGMVFVPHVAVPDAPQSEIFLLMNQGFIALAMGVVTAMLWVRRNSPPVLAFGIALFTIYHGLVTLSGLVTTLMGNDFGPFVIHLVLAVMFAVLWLGRTRIAF